MRRAVVGLLLAWTLVQGLREPWRALQYHLADPWPAEAPVLWTTSSTHIERLDSDLRRLRLGDLGTLGMISDAPGLDSGQGWYLYLWVAYLLPEYDVSHDPLRHLDRLDGWLVFGEQPEHVDWTRTDGVCFEPGGSSGQLRLFVRAPCPPGSPPEGGWRCRWAEWMGTRRP